MAIDFDWLKNESCLPMSFDNIQRDENELKKNPSINDVVASINFSMIKQIKNHLQIHPTLVTPIDDLVLIHFNLHVT